MSRIPGPITIVAPGSAEEALFLEDSAGNRYPVRGPDAAPGYAVADYRFIEPSSLSITALSLAHNSIGLTGDYYNTRQFLPGDEISLFGSSANDDVYHIADAPTSVSFDGTHTTLVLEETLPDSTVGGAVVRTTFGVIATLPPRTTIIDLELFPQSAPWDDATARLNANAGGDVQLLADIDLSGDLTDAYDPTDVTPNTNYVSLGSAAADYDVNVPPFGAAALHGGGIYYENGTTVSITVSGIVEGFVDAPRADLRVRLTTATAPPTINAR